MSAVSYTLSLEKVCKAVVKYSNGDGISFYAPKPVAGVPDPPEYVKLTITAASLPAAKAKSAPAAAK